MRCVPSLILSNPLGADDAQRIGLDIREYAVGEIISVNDFAFATLIRTGYALAYGDVLDVLIIGDGPPNIDTGADGQWYLDKLNEVLWGPKTDGLWPSNPIRPDRGVQQLQLLDNYHLQVTYSTGTVVDLGNVRGAIGPETSDATATVKGKLALAGDLGGTADAPTVPAVQAATSAATPSTLVHRDGSAISYFGEVRVTAQSAPSSVARRDYVDTKIPASEKGVASGVATLDSGGKIPPGQLPPVAITNTFPVANQAAMLALVAEVGDVAIRVDGAGSFILSAEPANVLSNWTLLTTRSLVSADVTDATPAATPGKIALRDSAGRLAVATPAASGDAATKGYVDGSVVLARQRSTNNIFGPYTLQAADAGRLVRVTSASAANVTLPAGITPVGTVIEVTQGGAGAVAVVAGSGVTITSRLGLTLSGLGARAALVQVATDQWLLSGDLLDPATTPPIIKLRRAASLNVVNASFTLVPWDTKMIDTHGMWAVGQANPERIICQRAGYWRVTAQVALTGTPGGRGLIRFNKNSPTSTAGFGGRSQPLGATFDATVDATDVIDLAVNDYINAWYFQDSGGTVTTGNADFTPTQIVMEWLRPL